jgi:hypothetical protein
MDLALSLAEFSYNNSKHRSTGRSPFSVVYTKVPTHVVDLVKLPSTGSSKSAVSFADNYTELFEEIRNVLEAQNQKYKQLADCKRRPKSFQVGDKVMVYLRKERLPLDIKGKLRQRKYGPFSILRRINDNAYMIDLLAEIRISNSFNVADLTLYNPEEALYEDNSRSSFKQLGEVDGEQQGE